MATLTFYLDTRTIEKEKANPGSTKLAGIRIKKAAVYFRLSHRGVQKPASVKNLYIDPEKWNQQGQKVKGYDHEALDINDRLNKIHKLLTQDIFRERHPDEWTCEQIRNYYKNFNFFKNRPYEKGEKTLSDYSRDYINERKDLAETTISSYKKIIKALDLFEEKYQISLVPKNITEDIMTKFLRFLSDDEIIIKGKVIKKKFSPSNVRYHITLLSGIHSWYNLPFQLPGRRLMSSFHTIHEDSRVKEVSRLSIPEVIDLYNMPVKSETEEKVRDLMVFCCFTGPRQDELWGLTKDNIELIVINENGKTLKFKALCYHTGKNKNKYLQVPLNAICLDIIDKWSKRNFLVKRKVRGKVEIFTDALLPILSSTTICDTLTKLLKRLGLTKKHNVQVYRENQIVTTSKYRYELVTFHKSRHTFGSFFLQNGCSPEAVRLLLGHSDLKTTQIYADMGKYAAYEGWKVMGNALRITQVSERSTG